MPHGSRCCLLPWRLLQALHQGYLPADELLGACGSRSQKKKPKAGEEEEEEEEVKKPVKAAAEDKKPAAAAAEEDEDESLDFSKIKK